MSITVGALDTILSLQKSGDALLRQVSYPDKNAFGKFIKDKSIASS